MMSVSRDRLSSLQSTVACTGSVAETPLSVRIWRAGAVGAEYLGSESAELRPSRGGVGSAEQRELVRA